MTKTRSSMNFLDNSRMCLGRNIMSLYYRLVIKDIFFPNLKLSERFTIFNTLLSLHIISLVSFDFSTKLKY